MTSLSNIQEREHACICGRKCLTKASVPPQVPPLKPTTDKNLYTPNLLICKVHNSRYSNPDETWQFTYLKMEIVLSKCRMIKQNPVQLTHYLKGSAQKLATASPFHQVSEATSFLPVRLVEICCTCNTTKSNFKGYSYPLDTILPSTQTFF